MDENPAKIFTLAEANAAVEQIAAYTSEVVELLHSARTRLAAQDESGQPELPEATLKEVEVALRRWSERVAETGAHPKGYFTVDFQSADPELFYCWSWGEEEIGFVHKVWENFTHRRPLSDSNGTVDHMRWVN
jgi:hypothetical protein